MIKVNVMPSSINYRTKPQLNKTGRRGIVLNLVVIFFSLPLLMISAGTIYWINGWVYFVLIVLYEVVYVLFLLKINPGLLNERGNIIKEGTKRFDKIFAVLYIPLAFLVLIISGLDAVRYGWTTMTSWINILGVILFIMVWPLSLWALSVNSYFSFTVRIQKDHKVCQTGPYKYIRHPGYAAGIVSILASPFILGSWWGITPSALIAVMLVIRTTLEDRTLQKELDGYKDYTKTTPYRLIPYVW